MLLSIKRATTTVQIVSAHGLTRPSYVVVPTRRPFHRHVLQQQENHHHHHHHNPSKPPIRRSYSCTSHLFHYSYPQGPGHYGSPPVASVHHATTNADNGGHNHDHHHDHHHHHHHQQQQQETRSAIATTPPSQPPPLLNVDPSVSSWNDTVSKYDMAYLQQQQSHRPIRTDFRRRGYTVGIGGPVGSGKTATVLALCQTLPQLAQQLIAMNPNHVPTTDHPYRLELGVVTNDIFTQEDAEFLHRHHALGDVSNQRIIPVETGGCPHTAIREDISSNIAALETITKRIQKEYRTKNNDNSSEMPTEPNILLLCESGGDNLAANFSYELVDLTIYVIDVAGGDKVPRKGGPGISQSDLLVINKIDLAHAVQSDLHVMYRDANLMRTPKQTPTTTFSSTSTNETLPIFTKPVQPPGPTLFCAVKHNIGVLEIGQFILQHYWWSTTGTDQASSTTTSHGAASSQNEITTSNINTST